MFSKFIHATACISTSFFKLLDSFISYLLSTHHFLAIWIVFTFGYYGEYIYENSHIRFCKYLYLQNTLCIFHTHTHTHTHTHRIGIFGSCIILYLTFSETVKLLWKLALPFYILISSEWWECKFSSNFLRPHQGLLLLFFFVIDILMNVKCRYHKV